LNLDVSFVSDFVLRISDLLESQIDMTIPRSDHAQISGLVKNRSARALVAGDLEAIFLPDHGMLGASLRYKGMEILRRVEDLEAAAARGSSAGIPLLYPWANRLAEPRYRVLGQEVTLDRSSPLLHFDEHGLPMHGVPWPLLCWTVTDARQDFMAAQLEWSSSDLLTVFPFRHRVELAVTLRPDGLTLETTVVASSQSHPVPVSFGFHPYFGFSESSRANWHLELPAMRKLTLDERGIPTGDEEPFAGFNAKLGENNFDDGFALTDEQTTFSVAGATCKVSVELLAGYRHAQVFAPKDKDYIAIEPMIAPASALTNGRGLRFVQPGGRFRAVFRIGVD
jgi:aldose 1-epimerase